MAREATVTGVYATAASVVLGGAVSAIRNTYDYAQGKIDRTQATKNIGVEMPGSDARSGGRSRAWDAHSVPCIQGGSANAVEGECRRRRGLGAIGSRCGRSRIFQGGHHRRNSCRTTGPNRMHHDIGHIRRCRDRGRTWPRGCCRWVGRRFHARGDGLPILPGRVQGSAAWPRWVENASPHLATRPSRSWNGNGKRWRLNLRNCRMNCAPTLIDISPMLSLALLTDQSIDADYMLSVDR